MTRLRSSAAAPLPGGLCRAIGIGTLVLLLAGCVGTTTAPWGFNLGDYRAAPRDLIGVASVAASHPVRLARGGHITKAERDNLDAFVAEVARNRPESLRVVLHGRATPAQVTTLRGLLVADGVDPRHISLAADRRTHPPVPRGTIVVAVERAIAIAPNCPGSMGHPTAPEDNLAEPNFGCADVANLAAMIGDPHHLVRGASSIYYLGERGAADVAAYREDKVKELPKRERIGTQ